MFFPPCFSFKLRFRHFVKSGLLGKKLHIILRSLDSRGVKKRAFIMVDMAFGLSMVTDLLTSEAYFCIHPTYCGLE